MLLTRWLFFFINLSTWSVAWSGHLHRPRCSTSCVWHYLDTSHHGNTWLDQSGTKVKIRGCGPAERFVDQPGPPIFHQVPPGQAWNFSLTVWPGISGWAVIGRTRWALFQTLTRVVYVKEQRNVRPISNVFLGDGTPTQTMKRWPRRYGLPMCGLNWYLLFFAARN